MVWKKPEIFSPVVNSMTKPIIEKSCSEFRILEFLSSVDREFVPFLSEKVNLSQYAHKLSEQARNVFLVVDGYDVGHAAYYSNDLQSRTAFLTSICVRPGFRGSGLAEVLLGRVLLGAMNDGMKKLLLEVDKRNQAAVRFYRKHGFTDCGNSQMECLLVKDGLPGAALDEDWSGKSSSHS